jgi:hypothetical protein
VGQRSMGRSREGKLTWRWKEDAAAVALSAWSGNHGDMREQGRERDGGREWRGQGRRSRARPRSFQATSRGEVAVMQGSTRATRRRLLPTVGHGRFPVPDPKFAIDNTTPNLQLNLHFLPSIILKPICHLINRLHHCVELHVYCNFA